MLERLSSLYIGPLKRLTGAQFPSSLSDVLAISSSHLGRLKELKRLTVLGETYLQLEGVVVHFTILLTSRLRVSADQLTALCHDTGIYVG